MAVRSLGRWRRAIQVCFGALERPRNGEAAGHFPHLGADCFSLLDVNGGRRALALNCLIA